jgi:lipopolysaccharide export system protein LptC
MLKKIGIVLAVAVLAVVAYFLLHQEEPSEV